MYFCGNLTCKRESPRAPYMDITSQRPDFLRVAVPAGTVTVLMSPCPGRLCKRWFYTRCVNGLDVPIKSLTHVGC